MTTGSHQATRTAIAEEALNADTRDHLHSCPTCQEWQNRLNTVITVAPTLFPEPAPTAGQTDQIVAAVQADASRRQHSRINAILGAAAALVIVTVGTFVWTRDPEKSETTAMSTIAAKVEKHGSFRFVFEVAANVTIDLAAVDGGEIEPLSLRQLPVCTTTQDPVLGRLDIDDLLNSALLLQPCAALEQIRAEIGTDTADTATRLAATRFNAEKLVAEIREGDEQGSTLQQSTARALERQLEALIAAANSQLQALIAAQDATIRSLSPVASAASNDQSVDEFVIDAEDGVVALRAALDMSANLLKLPTNKVGWESVATGTWTVDGVTIKGTAAAGPREVIDYSGTDDDPLGVAQVVLTDPEVILAILRSAPESDASVVRWEIPKRLLTIPDLEAVTATATVIDGNLDTLVLFGRGINRTEITVTLTPER